MNDTILNKRQKEILRLLQNEDGLSSTEICQRLPQEIAVAKVTIIRDMSHLVDLGLARSEGKARSIVYHLHEKNPMLAFIDMGEYFEHEMSERHSLKQFQESTLKRLHYLFSPEEQAVWKKSSVEFKKRVSLINPTIYRRELERFIIEFSWKSSQIEGNTYDLLETETLIKQHIEARGRTEKEAIMILNHKDAFDTILKQKKSFQNLSYSMVMQLHNVLVKGLAISTGIRTQPVRITGTVYTPPQGKERLSDLLRQTIIFINQSPFPPEKAFIAASMIAYLQPFADGNKRTARMLANALLLAYDYFPLSYRTVDPNEYTKAMILFYEQNNLYHLKRIYMEQLNFAKGNYFLV